MTALERELEKKGYTFTGSYSFSKKEMLERAKKLRKEGCYATVVFERGHRQDGYSIYSKPKKKE